MVLRLSCQMTSRMNSNVFKPALGRCVSVCFFRNLINNVNYADCLVLKQHEVGVDILSSVVGNMLKREMPIPWLRKLLANNFFSEFSFCLSWDHFDMSFNSP